jgi:Mce-associated membrane protein
VAPAEQLVAQAGVSREAEVFSTGVVTLDSDSATTLVAGTFTDTYRTAKGGEQEQRPVPFRIEVDLVKTDDEWLVDDFTPVTGAEK